MNQPDIRARAKLIALCCALLIATPSSGLAQFYSERPTQWQVASGHRADEASGRELSDHARQMLEDAELCDVAIVDAQRAWAVGDRGAIWHTADGGRTWRLQNTPVDARLHSVCFLDAQTGWAAGGFIHPYTHRTQGVLLRTHDGGQRWSLVPDTTLPLLRRVQFVSPTQGWLIGVPSPLYPSGLFTTRDAGRSWQPVPGSAAGDWLCGDFPSDQHGAIAGRNGALLIASPKGFLTAQCPQLGLRAIHDMQLEAQSGWLVGDNGLVLTSLDRGQCWQAPRGAIPAAARREFDFSGVAVVGNSVWAVGSPGTSVLHSIDGGQSWQLQTTEQTLPLQAIRFCDAQHGWAVGALGTILATRDGGRTWLRQHSGGTRAALLIVLTDAEEVPLELVARLAGEEGYLTVAESVGRRDLDTPRDYTASSGDRAQQAIAAVGGSGLQQTWQFPLRERALNITADHVIAAWDAQHNSHGLRSLEEHLVRRIRQWRPDVIVAPAGGSESRADDDLVRRVTLSAVAAASDERSYPEQVIGAKLPPWRVKKVFTLAAHGETDDVTLTAARLALRSGRSLGDAAARWQGLLTSEPVQRSAAMGFRLVRHDVNPEMARRDFFSGIELAAGGEARRRLSDLPVANADFLRDQAQKQRLAQRLLSTGDAGAVSDVAWLAQAETLTSTLPRDSAARAIFQLAQQYEQSGRVALAGDALQMLATRYADTPESAAAQRRLFFAFASSEQSWRLKLSDAGAVRPATAIGAVDGSGGALDQPTADARSLEGLVIQRSNQAIALMKTMEKSRPALATDPSLQLALAVAMRTTGDGRGAEAIYRRLAVGSDEQPWASCARAELWLAQPRGACPRPLVRLRREAARPYLDGQLGDAVWQGAQTLALTSLYGDDRAWPAAALLACDGEFLYLAATCRRVRVADEPLPRNEDLSTCDRIELCLDANRDWDSCFTLAMTAEGTTADACAGDFSWSPKWYATSHRDDQTWTIEAAIPLAALGTAVRKGDAWGVSVRRIAPGLGVQSWAHSANASGGCSGLGLVLFE